MTIVGLGLIGGSLAAAFKRTNIPAKIVGVDCEAVVAKALTRNLVSEGYGLSHLDAALAGADLIILAAPISRILDLLAEISGLVDSGALVTDVGSTKERIVTAAAKCLPQGVYFLGGHPMAGSEKSGLEHVDPFLFENAIYVLTEANLVPSQLLEGFVELLRTVGAKVILLPARLHDQIAAVVSHLPQILAVTLMKCASQCNEDNPAYLQLAAGGFRDMTRVASSPYAMWSDILRTNQENIENALSMFGGELKRISDLLSQQELASIFDSAARDRLSIPKDSRGFLNPHFDISVVVEDKPGVIAEISGILADKNVNIKDIEILKMREGDAGTLRLAFESKENRDQAIALLVNHGYSATPRA